MEQTPRGSEAAPSARGEGTLMSWDVAETMGEQAGGSLPMMRSFRRRIGERRISAPIRVVRAFIRAFFDYAIGHSASGGHDFTLPPSFPNGFEASLGPIPSSARTIDPATFVDFIGANRYRLAEQIDDDLAAR